MRRNAQTTLLDRTKIVQSLQRRLMCVPGNLFVPPTGVAIYP